MSAALDEVDNFRGKRFRRLGSDEGRLIRAGNSVCWGQTQTAVSCQSSRKPVSIKFCTLASKDDTPSSSSPYPPVLNFSLVETRLQFC